MGRGRGIGAADRQGAAARGQSTRPTALEAQQAFEAELRAAARERASAAPAADASVLASSAAKQPTSAAPKAAEPAPKRITDFGAEVRRRLGEGLTVGGRTYPQRERLKRMGCIWAANERVWLAPDAETRERANALCGVGGRSRPTASSPTASTTSAHDDEALLAATGRAWAGDERRPTLPGSTRFAVGDVVQLPHDERDSSWVSDERYLVLDIEDTYTLSRGAIEDMYGAYGADTMRPGPRTRYRVRPVSLTADEQAVIEARQARAQARKQLSALHTDLFRQGEWPAAAEPRGEHIVVRPKTIYGSGEWFVIDDEQQCVWAVRNNGGDGDYWGANNVRTGGAGAIGARVPYSDELVSELRELAATADVQEEVA